MGKKKSYTSNDLKNNKAKTEGGLQEGRGLEMIYIEYRQAAGT